MYYLFTQIDSSHYSEHKIIIIKVTKKYTIIKKYTILYILTIANYIRLKYKISHKLLYIIFDNSTLILLHE